MKTPKNNPNGKYELVLQTWDEFRKKWKIESIRSDSGEDLEIFFTQVKNTSRSKKKKENGK